MVLELEWYDLYREKWGKRIVPGAVAHPAKIAYGLAERIYDFMTGQDWIYPDCWILDVFGGQQGTGFGALKRGMNYVSIELERRFFEMGAEEYVCPGFTKDFWRRYQKRPAYVQGKREKRYLCPECEAALKPKTKYKKGTRQVIERKIPYREGHLYQGNLPYWQRKYAGVMPNWGEWIAIRGDSRYLRQCLAGTFDSSVISTPYGTRTVHGQSGIDPAKFVEQGKTGAGSEAFVMDAYGQTPGNLDRMPQGAVVSTPYGISTGHPSIGSVNKDDWGHTGKDIVARRGLDASYGKTDGQLGDMPAGAVMSPSYGDSSVADPHVQLRDASGISQNEGDGATYGKTAGQTAAMPAGAVLSSSYGGASGKADRTGHERAERRADELGLKQGLGSFKTSEAYGDSDGQIGGMPEGDAPTAAVLSSPYNLPMSQDHNGTRGGQRGTTPSEQGAFVKYGNTPGQIEGLPLGEIPSAAVISTPYADSVNQSAGANDAAARIARKAAAGIDVTQAVNVGGPNSVQNRPQVYGSEEAQLGAMPLGDISSVITSTPYAGVKVAKNSSGVDLEKQYKTYRSQGGGASFDAFAATQALHSQEYGTSPGQLSVLPPGEVDAAAFSSPYLAERIEGGGDEGSSGLRMEDGSYVRGAEGWEARKALGARYGASDAQLGNLVGDGEENTFWGATRMILAELFAVLKPGGVLASVTGDYIRDGKRVYFGQQWCTAAEQAGFVLVAHAKAWKVKTHPGTVDLFGEEVEGKKVQHLGMFRKMANAKNVERNPDDPDAAIESEDVWFLQKPEAGGGH